ncbi:hypothetical protein QJS10_CPA16g00224 [Acorus calamus]|uniref:Uncharacterized protein n=1 Tax=Acorus calamus TaxID=4465 RepID=A0AAV9CYM6_ACOCL|nr:hypothetical protein QJS10_CPA16g00224 [Acorus calamus]
MQKAGDCEFFAWVDDMHYDAYELERKMDMIKELVDVKTKELKVKMSKIKVKINSLEEEFKEMVEKRDNKTFCFGSGGFHFTVNGHLF